MMVGRGLAADAAPVPAAAGPVRLAVAGLTSPARFSGVDLAVRGGEIVGLAGLVGAGRTELAQALFGLDPDVQGRVEVDGRPVRPRSPREAVARGLALVPEDRKRHGLVLSMNVRENVTLPLVDRFRRWLGVSDARAERRLAEEYRSRLAIRTPSVETPVAALSGGNQQKVVLARWVAAGGGVLLVDEPTRGVDVGAKREIHDLLADLARQGAAVLVISSDLPELLAISHRIVVLRQGRVAATLSRQQATPEAVLRWMTGLASSDSPQPASSG
jgi:ABC-type sugar transport system ATPase subunit